MSAAFADIDRILNSDMTREEKKAALGAAVLPQPIDVGLRNEDMKFRADQRRSIATTVTIRGGQVKPDYAPLSDHQLMENL